MDFFASQISLAIGFHTLLLNPLSSSGETVAWVRAVWDRDGPSLSSCFKILNLTLEFGYFVGGYPQDGNINLGIGISNIFGFGSLNATELAVVAPIGSTFTLHVQGSRSISAEGLQCPTLRLALPWFPRKSKSEIGEDDSLVHGAL